MVDQIRKKRQSKETGIWIPKRILEMKELRCSDKMLLSYIYSFGIRGCYQSNQTLSRVFNVSSRSISEWIKSIHVYLYFKAANGASRTLWVKFHPAVVSRVRATRVVEYQQERIRATSLDDKKQRQTVTTPWSEGQNAFEHQLAEKRERAKAMAVRDMSEEAIKKWKAEQLKALSV